MRSPAVLLLAAVGCEHPQQADLPDCRSFADLEVVNPDGLAPPEATKEVLAALRQFGDWNGGGVCVDEVRLVDAIVTREGDAAGRFYGRSIEVVYSGSGLTRTTHHELCHAIDHQLGGFSETRPDWFSPEDPHEAFAQVCERGPRDLGLMRGLEAICGVDVGAARQEWVNDEVFGEAGLTHREPAGAVPITLTRREIQGLPEQWSTAVGSGSTDVFVEAEEHDGEVVRLRSAILDPATAAVTAIVEGPTVDPGVDALLQSDGAPLAVHLGPDGGSAWRVEADGYVEVPFDLPVVEGRLDGVVVGGDAHLVVDGHDGRATFWRVDLATGAAAVLPWPDGIERMHSLAADGDRIVGYAPDEDGVWRWVTWDRVSGAWSVEPFPVPSAIFARMGLPDGRLLTVWSDSQLVGGGLQGLAVVDPATGDWRLADQACDEDVIGGSFQLLSVGGEAWMWEPSNAWSPDDPLFGSTDLMTRIQVGAP